MYHKAKYIVGEVPGGVGLGVLCAVLFPETVGHDDMSQVFIPGTIRSAGFFHADENKVYVYGESISLRIKSNPEIDERFVGRAMAHSEYALL